MMKSVKPLAVPLSVLGSICLTVTTAAQSEQQRTPSSRPTILVTAASETDTSTSINGAATAIGHVAVGTAGANTSTYEHSEIWEVVRRFSEECPAAGFVTNPETPHTLTIHVDYEKANAGIVVGTVVLYQLVLLDHANNPLYVSKKNWLRREIKPVCKVIQQQ